MPKLAYTVFFEKQTSAAAKELGKDVRRTLRGTLRSVNSPPPDAFLQQTHSFLYGWKDVEEARLTLCAFPCCSRVDSSTRSRLSPSSQKRKKSTGFSSLRRAPSKTVRPPPPLPCILLTPILSCSVQLLHKRRTPPNSIILPRQLNLYAEPLELLEIRPTPRQLHGDRARAIHPPHARPCRRLGHGCEAARQRQIRPQSQTRGASSPSHFYSTRPRAN